MIELAIAIVIVAGIAGFIANKYLDMKYALNTTAADAALSAATAEMHKTFDSRINKAFENHALIKQEFESLKLQIGLRNSNINVTR